MTSEPALPIDDADGSIAALRMLALIEQCVRARAYDAVRPLIAADGEFFGSFEPVMHGFDELRERQFMQVWPRIGQFTIPPESIRVGAAGDLAWASNRFHTSGTDAGGATLHREGRMTWIFERRAGSWVIVHSHDSLSPNRVLGSAK